LIPGARGFGQRDVDHLDLPPIVREITDDWLSEALARAHEPRPIPQHRRCGMCTDSPLRPSLGEFAAWPDALLHPLLLRLGEVIEAAADAGVESRRAEARTHWLHLIDVDEDGTLPDDDMIRLATQEFRSELEVIATIREAIAIAASGVVRVTLSDHLSPRALIAGDVLRLMIDRTTEGIAHLSSASELLPDERDALRGALDRVVGVWVLWLPSGEWMRAPDVPQGAVCGDCAVVPRVRDLQGPHGAVHPLAVALGRVLIDHIAAFGEPRVEPPVSGDPDAPRREVARAYSRWFDDSLPRLEGALRSYVLGDVDEQVRDASRHLLVAPEDAAE
jgi:hypothetical protein